VIPDIIDNSTTERKLSHVLNELVKPGSSVFIASGYFNLSGFNLLKDRLRDASAVSILIGKALTPRDITSPELFLDELRHEAESNMDNPLTRGLIGAGSGD
jgi:hypothetical protein